MKLKEIIEADNKYYMNTFGRRTPVCFTHGKGMKLWDTEGKEYLDMFGGIAVSVLGHSHPALVVAICKQAEKLIHCSSLYYIESQAALAKVLVENSSADRVFFCNSGAEANEGALKLARIYFKKKNMPEKYEVITLTNSFHGRTMATLAATGQVKYQKPYEPLLQKFKHVPINDYDALAKAVGENTCAVMLEMIQGESGVHPLTNEYVNKVVSLCNEKGLLLIVDEVQTGMGRTGKLFCHENYGISPDIFTLAKGLAGGVPIGALCAKEEVAAAFSPGDHGSTFGGNPLACSAALTVLETIQKEGLIENAVKMGSYLCDRLQNLKKKFSIINEIRGFGLMIGISLNADKAVEIKELLFKEGVLLGSVGTSTLRILPPLIISVGDVELFIEKLVKVLKEV